MPSRARGQTTSRPRGGDLLLAGLCWGGLGWLLAHRAFPSGLWMAVMVSPGIGLLIGRLLQPRFEASVGWRRAAVSLGSVYLGGTLFAVGIALGTVLETGRRVGTVLGESLLGTWWGMTVTGFLLVLWPLAHLTHWWLEWRDGG